MVPVGALHRSARPLRRAPATSVHGGDPRRTSTTARSPGPISRSAGCSTSSARSPTASDTIVIITSDHGDGFMRARLHRNHGTALYRELLHVPLHLLRPRRPAAAIRRRGLAARHRADHRRPGRDRHLRLSFEGESLVPQLFYGKDDRDRIVFAETNAPEPQRAAISERLEAHLLPQDQRLRALRPQEGPLGEEERLGAMGRGGPARSAAARRVARPRLLRPRPAVPGPAGADGAVPPPRRGRRRRRARTAPPAAPPACSATTPEGRRSRASRST